MIGSTYSLLEYNNEMEAHLKLGGIFRLLGLGRFQISFPPFFRTTRAKLLMGWKNVDI
jgi:hypothetical protein